MPPSAPALLIGSLPMPRTGLIGREGDIAAARALLLDASVPLLTLTGPGGVGKTRLALAIATDIAAHFADGVVWVDLAPLADPALVPTAAAQALGLAPSSGVPLVEEITSALRSRQQLLLLDNCEHVLAETAALVSRVLTACPAVQVLATSRAPLRVQGEHEHATEPLPLPADDASADGEMVGRNDAVRLFVERACAVGSGLLDIPGAHGDIADICRRLDGLPLAIELAAGRTRLWPPAVLRARLERRLPVLTGGRRDAPARQQTVRDTIGWSYGLLTPEEQALFRRLSVFAGGFTLEAAQAVSGGNAGDEIVPVLERLVEQNLVRRMETRGDPRFTMLETIREYGLEQLAGSGEEEEDEARDRHAAYFLALIERIDANVFEHLPEATTVLAQLQEEYPNLRAALARFEATGAIEPFVQLAGNLHAFWIHEGQFQEGRRWLEPAVALGESASLPARVWAQVGLVGMLHYQEPERALALLEEAVILARMSGDDLAIGLASEWRAIPANETGHLDLAEACLTESHAAFARLPPRPWIAFNLTLIEARFAWIAFGRRELISAEAICVRALERMRTLEREHSTAYVYADDTLTTLGYVARARGDHLAALAHYQEALRVDDQFNDALGVLHSLIRLACTLTAMGRQVTAARLSGAAEAICERLGLPFDTFVWEDAQKLSAEGMWLLHDRFQPADASDTAPPRVRDRLDFADPALASHWAAGRSMSVEAAVAEALAIDPLDASQVATPALITKSQAYGLTPREQEILSLLCERLTDPEIAARLFISRRTASTHVANLYAKLGVGSRREAAALAVRDGLV